jgi:type I restriction enzyme S subunit
MMPNNDLPDRFKETEIGPIPVDWEVVPLSSLARVKYGKAKPKQEGTIPAVGSGGTYAWVNEALVDFPTLVIGRKGTAGRAWLVDKPCWPSDTTFYLEWTQEVDIHFLFGYLTLNPLSGEHAKTTLPSLSRPDLENYLVPLPPLPEQRRIAHVLSTIQRAIAAQDDLIAAAREVKRSLMQRLFTYGPGPEPAPTKETEIGEIPEHWEAVRLGEIAKIERGKFAHRPRNDPRFYGGTIPFIQTGDVANSGSRITSYSQTLNELGLSVSRVFPKGTIVITIAANIGYTGILRFDSAFPDSLIGITPTGSMDNIFLEYYLQTQQPKMDALAPRGTQKNINIQFLKPWPVLKPPLAEQREIAEMLSAIDRKIEAEEQRKAALQALFQSMLHQLMTGQVRTPDTVEVPQ